MTRTYGFADQHSVLLGYRQHAGDDDARRAARDLADDRIEAIEYWLDVRAPDGELPPSLVVRPSEI